MPIMLNQTVFQANHATATPPPARQAAFRLLPSLPEGEGASRGCMPAISGMAVTKCQDAAGMRGVGHLHWFNLCPIPALTAPGVCGADEWRRGPALPQDRRRAHPPIRRRPASHGRLLHAVSGCVRSARQNPPATRMPTEEQLLSVGACPAMPQLPGRGLAEEPAALGVGQQTDTPRPPGHTGRP